MTHETIVNHVPETLGQKIEKAKLNLATHPPTLKPDVEFDRPQTETRLDAQVKLAQTGYADHNRPEATGADLKVDRDFIVPGQPGTSDETQAKIDALTKPIADPAGDVLLAVLRFEEFRTKVISAFKHMGFDTRKHFGV